MNSDETQGLLQALQAMGYLQQLNDAETARIEAELELVEVRGGDWLFRQGDEARRLFFLYKGAMRVIRRTQEGEEVILDVLEPGAAIGELALLTGHKRSASILAISDCALIAISQETMRQLSQVNPELSAQWMSLAMPRWQNTQMSGILARYFGDLDAEKLHFLKKHLTWRYLKSGEALFSQGDAGDSMAIVVNGRLRALLETPDSTAQILGEMGRGENAGEYSLLTGEPRSATVIAVRDTDLLMLDRDGFLRLSETYPHLILEIAEAIARRARQNGRARSAHARELTLAVLPLGEGVPLQPFMGALQTAVAVLGSTKTLSAAAFDAQFNRPGAAQTPVGDPLNVAITGWLNQQEAAYQYLLLETDHQWSEWTQRCLRNADRILLVADATAAPALSALEAQIFDMNPCPQVDLVLMQPSERELPQGTAAWLDARPPLAHHHVRLQNPEDFGRLARRLTGNATGLVLSGGAARGFAHLGVYQALQEAGQVIDVFGGTSMGALMAAGMALIEDSATIQALAAEYGSKSAVLDMTLPTTSVYKSEKITGMLKRVCGDVQIEDLWYPFFCISSNLSQSEPVVHRRGPLWQAVRASLAMPGIFSPVSYEGDILVDGGVMNNLPVDIMRAEVDQGTIVAVNANPRKEKPRSWSFAPSISGWQTMSSRLIPGRKAPRVPTLVGTVLRALALNSTYQLQEMEAASDLFIQLDTSGFGIMDWSSYAELVQLGYETAVLQIADQSPVA